MTCALLYTSLQRHLSLPDFALLFPKEGRLSSSLPLFLIYMASLACSLSCAEWCQWCLFLSDSDNQDLLFSWAEVSLKGSSSYPHSPLSSATFRLLFENSVKCLLRCQKFWESTIVWGTLYVWGTCSHYFLLAFADVSLWIWEPAVTEGT